MKNILIRLAETARLMVGIGSYQKYRLHMQRQHPAAPVMSETEYFRYCQNSRYPSDTNREIKRCPC